MVSINILIITGQNSYNIIKEVTKSIKAHSIDIQIAPISVSAFLSKEITQNILDSVLLSNYELVLIPGFVQWDAKILEEKFAIPVKKGPEFASDIPFILQNLDKITLSSKIAANKLLESTGKQNYEEIIKNQLTLAKKEIGSKIFYINKRKSPIIIGGGLPPPIIAEIVNCTNKNDSSIIKKARHYITSGADIIDIGCISNQPNPERVKEIIKLLRSNFNTLISVDSMDCSEIKAAAGENIDLILSVDVGNYKELLHIPKTIPIVILPTNIKNGYFPKEPKDRVDNLLFLTGELKEHGFTKLIADPLLETPISPGMCNSLESYYLYRKMISSEELKSLELPLFFGISNVVELMDVDSIGINGLLASIAIELDVGLLFTVEHSSKLMYGVRELKECMKLSYISKYKKTPPINLGLQFFRAKGKIRVEIPLIDKNNAINVPIEKKEYEPDEKGYFKIHVDHYSRKIYVLFYSKDDKLLQTFIGENAENLSKIIIEMKIIDNLQHVNYIGRELSRAEFCLFSGRYYIQDE